MKIDTELPKFATGQQMRISVSSAKYPATKGILQTLFSISHCACARTCDLNAWRSSSNQFGVFPSDNCRGKYSGKPKILQKRYVFLIGNKKKNWTSKHKKTFYSFSMRILTIPA